MALEKTQDPTFKLSLTFSEMAILQTALNRISTENNPFLFESDLKKLENIKSKIAFAEFEF